MDDEGNRRQRLELHLGGIGERNEIIQAAHVALARMDPIAWLDEEDQFKRLIYQAIAEQYQELKKIEDNNLAVAVVTVLSQAFKG